MRRTRLPNAPTSGENVTLNTIATFPAAGKSITIKYSATVNTPPLRAAGLDAGHGDGERRGHQRSD